MIEKLGKIKSVKFGFGGYQDVQIVFSFEVGGEGWGTNVTYECGWGHVSKKELKDPKSTYKWTHEDRLKTLGEKAYDVVEIMQKAKVDSLDKLKGIPVKVFFESECGRNHGFEVLTDVL